MTIEAKSKGEWPINWRLTSFPSDARLVLQIRQAARQYQEQHNITGPVADLEAEQGIINSSPIYGRLYRKVNQPITFCLATPVLRALSWLP